MWQKILAIFILFFLFALLQSSFFSQLSILGAIPNLVFVFFFILVFFNGPKGYPNGNSQVILLSLLAGIFLDIFSYNYLGPSIILLLALGFLLKKIQSLLKNKEDNYPFVYFAPLFIIFFASFEVLLMAYLRFFDSSHAMMVFDLKFIVGIIYNLIFAFIFFCIYKKCQKFTK